MRIRRREGNMTEENKADDLKDYQKKKFTADIENLEKELKNFEREWEKDKKKGQDNLEKIEKHIDEKINKE
jgi:Mg2+ and Co2+ transporter CorA